MNVKHQKILSIKGDVLDWDNEKLGDASLCHMCTKTSHHDLELYDTKNSANIIVSFGGNFCAVQKLPQKKLQMFAVRKKNRKQKRYF